jgi:hypothetical protein
MSWDEFCAANRRNWDERVAIHRRDATGFYAIERFLAGDKRLHALETRKVRFHREPAVRRVFIDRVGKFAGQPRLR